MTRIEQINAFLKSAGWENANRSFLAGDASLRSYDRVELNGKTAVLMDAPPPPDPENYLPAQLVDIPRWLLVDGLLKNLGVHSPQVFAHDIQNGFVLLEDLGDNSFTRMLDSGYDARNLYRMATESLIKVGKDFKMAPDKEYIYDKERMMADIDHLPNWVVKCVSKINMTPAQWEEYHDIWSELIDKMARVPRGPALYDYHVDNLILTPSNSCGVLDFQDVRTTAATYDIMTLLEDERRLVDPAIKQEMLDLYFGAFPELNTPEIRSLSGLVALQRHIKVVGQFIRYYHKDGKDKYMKYVPLVWYLIENCLENPYAKRLKEWMDKYVPVSHRERFQNKDAVNA